MPWTVNVAGDTPRIPPDVCVAPSRQGKLINRETFGPAVDLPGKPEIGSDHHEGFELLFHPEVLEKPGLPTILDRRRGGAPSRGRLSAALL